MKPLIASRSIPWPRAGQINIVVDGNSIMAGGQDTSDSNGGVVGWLTRHTYPFNQAVYSNVAIGGQNTDAMASNASDVDAAFNASKTNVLVVMEGTNQMDTTTDSNSQAVEKLFTYISARRATHQWSAVVVCCPPPVYYGDQQPQSYTDAYNAKLDAYNAYLRRYWPTAADGLIDFRVPGGPYDQARYPDYLKARFFDTTVINGISNNASFITEPTSGAVPNAKIHLTLAGITAMAPFFAQQLLRVPLHRG